MHEDKAKCNIVPGHSRKKDRQHKNIEVVTNLKERKLNDGPAQRNFMLVQKIVLLVTDEVDEIFCRHPVQRHNHVEKPCIEVLVAMIPVTLLPRREAKKLNI